MFGRKKKNVEGQLKQLYSQIDEAKKEFTKIIVKGLSENDSREVEFTCRIIRDELIPSLEYDKGESKMSSLKTLNKLINERRPPKDEYELSDLENASFFKILKDVHMDTFKK